jgi:hypothetical protein
MLRCRQAEGVTHVSHAGDRQSAVIPPGEIDPFRVSETLIPQDRRLLVRLIVVDAEHCVGQAALMNQSAVFGREVARPRMTERQVSLKSKRRSRSRCA